MKKPSKFYFNLIDFNLPIKPKFLEGFRYLRQNFDRFVSLIYRFLMELILFPNNKINKEKLIFERIIYLRT